MTVGNRHYNWKGYGEIPITYWNNLLSNARQRNLEVTITIETAWRLFLQQNRKCCLTGLSLLLNDKMKRVTASLDRIDSNLGYTVENAQWIHKDVNRMKSVLPQDVFTSYAMLISTRDQANYSPIEIIVPPRTSCFKGYKGITSRMWRRTKKQAIKRGVEFELNIEDVWDLYERQQARCALSGVPIYFDQDTATASLDRIDSDIGYRVDNIQWVHKDVNRMKSDYKQDYFLHICSLIASKHPAKEMLRLLNSPAPSLPEQVSWSLISRLRGPTKGRFKGVSRSKGGLFQATIGMKGSKGRFSINLGSNFSSEEDAARHYDFAALQLWGQRNCYLNFPDFDYSCFKPVPVRYRNDKKIKKLLPANFAMDGK